MLLEQNHLNLFSPQYCLVLVIKKDVSAVLSCLRIDVLSEQNINDRNEFGFSQAGSSLSLRFPFKARASDRRRRIPVLQKAASLVQNKTKTTQATP